MQLYFLPGLGFDRRIFAGLKLDGYEINWIDWIDPLANESLADYAHRWLGHLAGIENLVLICHSFGGVVAQEFAAQEKVARIILVSSIREGDGISFGFKLIRWLGIYRLFTRGLCLKTVRYWGKQHGYDTPDRMTLFKDMVGKQSNRYLQWALKQVSRAHTPGVPAHTQVFQIHGTEDKTLPFKLAVRPDVVVEGGGHFMVHRRPEEVERAILEMLIA